MVGRWLNPTVINTSEEVFSQLQFSIVSIVLDLSDQATGLCINRIFFSSVALFYMILYPFCRCHSHLLTSDLPVFLSAFFYSLHRILLSLVLISEIVFMPVISNTSLNPFHLFYLSYVKPQLLMAHCACCFAWLQQHQTVSCCNTLAAKSHVLRECRPWKEI